MVQKLHFQIYSLFVFFILFLSSADSKAQCAGNDNVMLTICDIANPASQTINLFSQLGGTPTAGGTWRDDDKSGGLNKTTGILNAQQIKKSGVYHYTYTVTGVSGCADNSAVVTVTIGGYTGVPAPNTSICALETSYNLFQVFNGSFLEPQIGGTWTDNDNSGGLNNNILDASVPVPDDTYSYTYTIPAIGTCPAPAPATIYVSIYRFPKPGTPSDLQLCSNQLAAYTNFDLNNQLAGEDSGGIWTEFGTSEINDDTDSFINIKNVYDTKGPGTYTFTYTVNSDNTVCKDRSSTVNIIIEKQLDFTGATLVINYDKCENEIATATYNAILTQGSQAIPNGSYEVTYSISGNPTPIKTTQSFSGGELTFPIPSANFQQVQDYTINIINIKDASSIGLCNNIIGTIQDVLHIYPIPKINTASLSITPVCQTFDALVDFSGTSNLTDGNYIIVYNLSGNNTSNSISAALNISGGIGSFIIPKNLIQNTGTSTVTITKITNSITGCTNAASLSKSFIVNPLPDATNLIASIKNICQGQSANVKLTGLGSLTSISITYELSGANIVGPKNINLIAAGGEANFVIPATDLPNEGLTSFTITNLTNTITGCALTISKKTDFTVNSIPNIPAANAVQSFCTSDNATVSNLSPQGNQYQWFDSATSSTPLSSSTPLVQGDYFVKEVNTATGCESPLKMISTVINTTPQINNATLSILAICQGNSVNVGFSGASNLADGNYSILYNLSGSNTAAAIPATLSVTTGSASFTINAALIPNSGTTTIAITNITNTSTNCSNTSTLSKSFVVNPTPDISNMTVTINNTCLGTAANVTISGLGTLSNISLSYNVSGANTIVSQTIPLVVSGGNTNFSISAASLSNIGSNTLAITNITNTVTGCSAAINSFSKNFTVNALPNSPTAGNQKFCETDLATVANLVPSGNQFKWYDTANSTAPLAQNKLLTTKNYFVKETNPATSCESTATAISVQINSVPIPSLKTQGNEFCGVTKPTILNLSNNTTASVNLAWYDAAINGTVLPNTHLLEEGITYYGFDYDASANCYSAPLPVNVTLTNCTITPEGLKIPDGFSPNGDGVNETFQIADIEFTFPNYTIEIFNRYGNILFKGDVNKPAWDGKNSTSSFISGDAPAGVYFYIIHYNKDNLPPKQGQLYLNR